MRRRRELGEILGGAWTISSAHYLPMFLVALVTAPLQLLSVIIQRSASSENELAYLSMMQIPIAVVALVATAGLIHLIHQATEGRPAEAGEGLDKGLSLFFTMFRTAFLSSVVALASLLAFPFLPLVWLFRKDAKIDGQRRWYFAVPFVLPAYLFVRWTFYGQSVVIEGKRNWAALDMSADLVRGTWWRVLGIVVVIQLTQLGPILLSASAAAAPPLVEGSVTALVSAAVLPFVTTAQTLLYYDLKARKALDDRPPGVPIDESDVPREGARDL